jgi:hypothetical protein
LSGALDRHPGLKPLSGHWGEFIAGWLDRLDETIGWAGYLDRPVSEYYREHVWVTPSGMYSQNQLNFILAETGAERIVHSEDFPYVIRDNVSDFLEQVETHRRPASSNRTSQCRGLDADLARRPCQTPSGVRPPPWGVPPEMLARKLPNALATKESRCGSDAGHLEHPELDCGAVTAKKPGQSGSAQA